MTVFISRELSAASDFLTVLAAAGYEARGFPLIRRTPLAFGLPPERPDWVFFASAFAVRCFFDGEGRKWGASPPPRFAAIGPATAAALALYVEKADFTGSGDPAATAEAFGARAGGATVLFPAARHSQRSIAARLAGSIRALHLEVYDNAPLPDPPFLPDDLLVFTSPMNARAYFSRHALRVGQRVAAIGSTTAATLLRLGLPHPLVPPRPDEKSLAETILRLPD